MTNRNFLIRYFFILLLFSNNIIFSAKIALGNVKSDSNKSFNFKIGPHVFFTNNESYMNFGVVITSSQEMSGNPFAIAKLSRANLKKIELDKKNENKKSEEEKKELELKRNTEEQPLTISDFIPLCPEKIKLNNNEDQPNPLNGAKISLLDLIEEYPIVVKDGDKKIYFLKNLLNWPKEASLHSTVNLNDAAKKTASSIIKIAVFPTNLTYGSYIFAAVRNNAGEDFGAAGSGIALILVNDEYRKIFKKNEETKKSDEVIDRLIQLRVVNADSNEQVKLEKKIILKTEEEQKKEEKAKKEADEKAKKESNDKNKKVEPAIPLIPIADNKAAPFDGTINAIKIKNDAKVLSNIIDMHWDQKLQRIYIAFAVKSNNSAGSGARAIVVGRLYPSGKLFFDPIAADDVFNRDNQIVGTNIPDQLISIEKVRTMHTSTLLSYLIVAGLKNEQVNGNRIYALPLVNREKETGSVDPIHGTLAKFDQEPKNYYNKEFLIDKGRAFVQPAKNVSDLLTCNDQAALVGAQELPLSANEKISDIFVVNDSVFVCINNDFNDKTQPGIFYSQAILDSKGRIASWSKWQRTAGTNEKITGAGLDIAAGQFWYMPNTNNINDTVKITEWNKDQKFNCLDNHFKVNDGGIHEIFEFPKSTTGFNNFSMAIATGFKKVVLMQTGSWIGNSYKPTRENFTNETKSIDGKIPQMNANTNFVSITGGDVGHLGPITCTDIAADSATNNRWIILAGIDGLAIGLDDNGRSWNGNISELNQISPRVSFKRIGKYSFVQKIQSDGKFLYVLTDKKLDRIKLSANDFKANNINAVTLADFSDKKFHANVVFTDFCVSKKFALIASNLGLFRVGNRRDITTARNCADVGWTLVNVPEGLYCISKLFFVSPTGNDSGFAQRGQLYVLSSYKGFNQSRVNRFFINLTDEINDKTIEPLPDFFIKDKLANFFEFDSFRELFWTDGAIILGGCSKDIQRNLNLHTLAPRVCSNTRSFSIKNLLINLQTTESKIDKNDVDKKKQNFTQIGKITRNSATGALFINGSFGLRVNQ